MADIDLIIKIPDHLYKLLKDFPSDSDETTIENILMKAVENGTPIPDNATNGDVAELVWGFKPRENTCIIPRTRCNGNPAECDECSFGDWWNAPYQKGGK